MSIINPPVTGMEYTIVPDGNVLPLENPTDTRWPGSDIPYTWGSSNIGWELCVPITGYRVEARYKVVTPTTTPAVGLPGSPTYVPATTTYTIGYPSWELISQELTCTSHPVGDTGNPFQQEQPYLIATPGIYGPETNPAVAGFIDGSCYDYFKVFDQSESAYLERLGPYDSTPIENDRIPTEPYDAISEIYPIDAVTKFIPDMRESVTVTYSLTTSYKTATTEVTDTISISHTVTQNVFDWSAQVQSLRSRSHFYNGHRPVMPDPRI